MRFPHTNCRGHTKGMKSRSCRLVRRIGTAVSATPHPDPSGGQAPALHFFIPPSATGLQFGTFRRWRAGMVVDWRPHFRAISSYETRGHTKGMKSRSCRLVRRTGTVDSATPHPDPSGGQAPALHFFIPPSATGLQFGTFRRWRAGMVVDWRPHFRAISSYELPRTHQGYEEPELSFGTAIWHSGFCHAPPRPQRGTSPRTTFFHSALSHRPTIRHVSPVESRHGG